MLRLYREKPHETNPLNENAEIPIFYDDEGGMYVRSSLGTTTAVLFRKITVRDDGAILFYGDSLRDSDVELLGGKPPRRPQRYA